ncbi:MAG: TraR/DksA C4-type zinc finger protein [Vulcanibacillus sp.]
MNQEELNELKQLLTEEKKSLLNNYSFGLNVSLNDSIGELSGYDNHPADIGTELFERGKDLALKENGLHTLELINGALKKMNQNEYGFCEKCKKEIPIERLRVVPYAKYCIEHQPDDSISNKRSIEEEYLGVSFRKEVNNQHINIEESWGKVAEYGTSSSIDYNPYDSVFDDDLTDSELEGFIIIDIYGNPLESQNIEREDLLDPDNKLF